MSDKSLNDAIVLKIPVHATQDYRDYLVREFEQVLKPNEKVIVIPDEVGVSKLSWDFTLTALKMMTAWDELDSMVRTIREDKFSMAESATCDNVKLAENEGVRCMAKVFVKMKELSEMWQDDVENMRMMIIKTQDEPEVL